MRRLVAVVVSAATLAVVLWMDRGGMDPNPPPERAPLSWPAIVSVQP
jgi:hypothetical protein